MGRNGRTQAQLRQTPSRGNSGVSMTESMGAEPVAEEVVVEEKTLPVSRVNEIVKKEKLEAANKARQEVEAQWAKKMEDMQAQQMQPDDMQAQQMQAQQQAPSMGGMQQVDAESIKKQVMEQIMAEARAEQEAQQKEQHQKDMEKVAGEFFDKMGTGKDLYDDFEEVTGQFSPASFPQVVFLASRMDNTPDIMYELAQHPQKLATIDYLAQRDPSAAQAMLDKLSQSINQNRQAMDSNKNAQAPLSRMKGSTVGGTDTGAMSLQDLKKASWLRG
jgi:hypothetical protein